jgi:hypothetical protein
MTVAAPTLELLEWVAARMRTYDDVREAWRSNCPRYAVWDDAVTDGLVRVATEPDSGTRFGRSDCARPRSSRRDADDSTPESQTRTTSRLLATTERE